MIDHVRAQFDLGQIYFENKYVIHDINKTIQYLTLASTCMFDEDIANDIDKLIDLLIKSSIQEHNLVQNNW